MYDLKLVFVSYHLWTESLDPPSEAECQQVELGWPNSYSPEARNPIKNKQTNKEIKVDTLD